MEKKMYTETLEKVRNDYAVRNIDKLEAAIKAGDMEKAERFLGRRYCIEGNVVKGLQNGRKMGIRSPLGKSDITQFQEMGTG